MANGALFPGFKQSFVKTSGATINALVGGNGPPSRSMANLEGATFSKTLVRYSFVVADFHRLLLAGFTGARKVCHELT